MYRVEIISNKSVQEDITDALEVNVPSILYTIIPLAYGHGGSDYKLGNPTWPETNFVLVSYVQDSEIKKVRQVIAAVKEKFKNEGIKIFTIKSEE